MIERVTSAPLDLSPYDAVLLVSFGGPEAPEEVIGMKRRKFTRERLATVC